jgi:2-dehydro-3-deoxyphosphogluconate aldolase/(4S)-4-hydroxy-2-oxoglutarate aldolase
VLSENYAEKRVFGLWGSNPCARTRPAINSMFPEPLLSRTYRTGVLAVLVVDDPDDAVPLAKALLAGGVDCMELTLRTPTAMEALRRIRAEVPDMLAGVGTVLSPELVDEAVAAGAAFGVAPGMNPRVVAAARSAGLPFAPGVCTPTDIEIAVEAGCTLLKFFPAEPCGGLAYLRSVAAPFAHLGVRFIPLGGIGAQHAARYLAEPCIHALGGSWIAPREMIQRKEWAAITRNAREVADIVKRVREGAA